LAGSPSATTTIPGNELLLPPPFGGKRVRRDLWREALDRFSEDAAMVATIPRFLFVYYTYAQQTLKVVDAMANALGERGCEARQAKIEFTASD
jgi:hypothetical protein